MSARRPNEKPKGYSGLFLRAAETRGELEAVVVDDGMVTVWPLDADKLRYMNLQIAIALAQQAEHPKAGEKCST